jgi:hypothetical protein
MASERYNYQNNYKREHLFGGKSFIFFSFLIVLAIIFVTAFYKGDGITGNIIGSMDQNNSVEFKSSLSVPEVSLDDEYEEIVLLLDKGSFVNLDNKKIALDNLENRIVIKNFKGDIKINGASINEFKGKALEVTINGLPIRSQDEKKLKFSISSGTAHKLFEINKGVRLREVSFTTSGNVIFGKDSLILNNEKITLKNYFGSLVIENKKLIFVGFAESLKIEGDSRKLVLSK